MKLIFHIGLNKTGSTHLQNMLSFNRDKLLNQGILYINPHVTSTVGEGASGNAAELALDFGSGRLNRVRRSLAASVGEGCKAGAHTICLSTEFMYHELVKEKKSTLFEAICKDVGFSEVTLAIVFREPVSHAVSAYVHRCGNQPMNAFTHWISSSDYQGDFGYAGYELWDELLLFQTNLYENRYFNIDCYDYSNGLDQILNEFTGVILDKVVRGISNVSVTCTEAEILRMVYRASPDLAMLLRKHWKELSSSLKASDSDLKGAFKKLVASNTDYENTIQAMSRYVSFSLASYNEEEGLVSHSYIRTDPNYVVTKYQIETFCDAITEYQAQIYSPKNVLKYILRNVFPSFYKFLLKFRS